MAKIQTITARSARGFSDWFIVGPKNFDYCCDCGLAHENRYRVTVNHEHKRVVIEMKSRRAKGRTHKHRLQRKLYDLQLRD